MAIHANEFGTKEKQKLTIKNKKLTATYTPTYAKGNNSSTFLIWYDLIFLRFQHMKFTLSVPTHFKHTESFQYKL